MKKIYVVTLLFLGIFVFAPKVKADTTPTGYVPHKVIVQFQNEFSSSNPIDKLSVVITKNYNISGSKSVESGTVLYLEIVKVNKETVGKLDATVKARIVKSYVPSKQKTIDVEKINPYAFVKLSKYEKLDVTDKAIDTGISVANYFVKNVTYPAHFVKGAIKNESGNILKSGFDETYDSSVFSYVSTGKPLVVPEGGMATLTFYTKDVHPTDKTAEESKVKDENNIDE